MPRVNHFEIKADNPDSLVEFYGEIFGWEFMKWSGPVDYWMIKTGEEDEPGIDGGLSKKGEQSSPAQNTISVPSVERFAEKIKERGGEIITPKMTITGVGYLLYFRDPEGNVFGIMEDDKSAL